MYVLKRIAMMIPMLFVVTLIVFSMLLLIPGDPAARVAGEDASQDEIAAARDRLGLNAPLPVQYANWVGGILLRGDFGTSLFNTRSVSEELMSRLPLTMSLALIAIIFALIISLPAGIIAGVNRGRWADRVATIGSAVGVSIPNFWLGFLLITWFALGLKWFPSYGYVPFDQDPVGWLSHLILPGFALGFAAAAEITRQLRGGMITVLDQDYIRTAWAKGLRPRQVIMKHTLKNAAAPAVTVLGIHVGMLLGGTVVVESIFGIPGLGRLAVDSVISGDVPMVQGVVIVMAIFVMIANLLVDLSYRYFNPKVKVLS